MNEKICGYELDDQQKNIVLDNSKYLLVIAGAGSGKTLTILGKIYYLVHYKKINPSEIICISFTNVSSKNLYHKVKNDLNIELKVYTFHSLALEILNKEKILISLKETLELIIDRYFEEDIYKSKYHTYLLFKYFKINSRKEIDENRLLKLKRNINTFLKLFKTNNYKLVDFINFSKKIKKLLNFNRKKEKIFLIFCINIYIIYYKYLKENGEVDFDDMIINATHNIKKNGYNRKLKYIIIDEYQDTSFIRFNLIKEIINKTFANLMVVGDDFQSIYRFTGCNIELFLNFNKYFKDAKMLKIETTYRNSQELIEIAGNFVMKNKYQIRKNMKSNKNITDPVIVINYTNLKDTFYKLVEKIYNESKSEILILGRNNKDIFDIIDNKLFKIQNDKVICLTNKDIDLKYLTVHKSKGLEANNVIIINMNDDYLGFPSKIENNKIFRLVSKKDNILYEEERRLFYVALTRSKNRVYLLTKKGKESIFIKELIKIYKVKQINILLFFFICVKILFRIRGG